MRFIIELDGVIFDVAPAYYRAHRDVATELGWSRLDQATFWRLTRTKGPDARILPGANPGKLKTYHAQFAERIDRDDIIEAYLPHADVGDALKELADFGCLCLVSTGSNLDARQSAVDHGGMTELVSRTQILDPDPRRRPAELRVLAAHDNRTIVAVASDAIVRPAREAELFTAGIASGACSVDRLRRAGADVVYRDLHELAQSLRNGAPDMIQAGLLPPPLEP